VQINAPPGGHLEFRAFLAVEQARVDFRVLMNGQGAFGVVRGDDQAQPPALLLRREALLLVAGREIALGRLNPYLEKMHGLIRARIEFAVLHAGAGSHPLHVARFDHRPVAERILVREPAR